MCLDGGLIRPLRCEYSHAYRQRTTIFNQAFLSRSKPADSRRLYWKHLNPWSIPQCRARVAPMWQHIYSPASREEIHSCNHDEIFGGHNIWEEWVKARMPCSCYTLLWPSYRALNLHTCNAAVHMGTPISNANESHLRYVSAHVEVVRMNTCTDMLPAGRYISACWRRKRKVREG